MEIEKSYDSSGHFKEMKDEEIEAEVKKCLKGESGGIRTQDTIIHPRQDSFIVDVFTITRHRIYELKERDNDESKINQIP